LKAIAVKSTSKEINLVWDEVPEPAIADDEVLLEIKATAVNRADLLQASGHYPPPPGASHTLGLEAAGVITAVGNKVTDFKVGQRVCALLSGGGYAERVAVPAKMLLELPAEMSFETAATIPEAWITAYLSLFLEAKLQPAERVLIHAGASGVGTAAIQLAVAASAQVFATAGSASKLEKCKELGAFAAWNYQDSGFEHEITTHFAMNGVDVVLDPVGANYLPMHMNLMNERGRLVIIGLMGGKESQINLAQILKKQLFIKGSTLRNKTIAEKIRITDSFKREVWNSFSERYEAVIDKSFQIAEAQAAHQYVKENRNIGKVVLKVAN